MPEDYQALLGELGVESADPVITDPVTTDPVTTVPTTDPSVIPETDPANPELVTDPAAADPATPTDTQVTVDPEVEARNQAFAAMRVQNAKYQKAMSRITQAMGASNEDEAIEKLIGASFDVQAKRENVDPVILRRLTDLEEKNQILDTATKQQFIKESFGAVQKKFNLDDKEVIAFAQKLTDQNVDIFRSNVPLDTLYLGMYHDTITSKKLEAEKQNWIKGQNEADKAPGVNPATGKPISKDKKEITTEADLDLILKTLK
jgi:hypothetical protein